MTYLQRPYEDLLLIYHSIIVYVEKNVFPLPIIFDDNLKVTSVEFLLLILICSSVKLTILLLSFYIKSLYTNGKVNLQNSFTALSRFFVKDSK